MASSSEEHDHRSLQDTDSSVEDELMETAFQKGGCCAWFPCLGSSSGQASSAADGGAAIFWERVHTAEKEGRWWTRGFKAVKKIREWSELAAGPRWKTFIRRFNRKRGGLKPAKFHYDPSSYAMNFDEGLGQNGLLDEDIGYRDFPTRYASIPASAKSSMDLGKNGPTFT